MDSTLKISCELVNTYNHILNFNKVPIIRSITIKNNSGEKLDKLRLRIYADSDFAEEFLSGEVNIEEDKTVEFSGIDIKLPAEYLAKLADKEILNISVEVIKENEIISSIKHCIELLPVDFWTGTELMPEMISWYVMSAQPAIEEIMTDAAKYMEKFCGETEFTGYDSRSAAIAKTQMKAIYDVLQKKEIDYVVSSDYKTPQRIHNTEAILDKKRGTCLELVILYCSCLEYAGLNPLIIFKGDHVLAGCWLEEQIFPDCIQYDHSALAKRAVSGVDIISVIECTDFTAGKEVDFNEAENHGRDKLENAEDFSFAVDVKCTKNSGIQSFEAKSDILFSETEKEITKQKLWERKLLDLSLRNSLLNFRGINSGVRVIAADLANLEDELSDGDEFIVCPAPEQNCESEYLNTLASEELKKHHLLTYLNEEELDKAMLKLKRQAKVSIEENGVNTIYLALGFLEWYETEKSEKTRYAPLVLMPVSITRKLHDRTFTIKLREDGIQVNITLLEMLRQNFGIDIQELLQLPLDEKGVDIQLIFNIVRKAILTYSRWNVAETACIGQFSFSRFIMWNDISNRSDELIRNKVAASLISGKKEWEDSGISITPKELDTIVPPTELAVPLSADSSQLAAVYAANEEKSFILYGPPGTGKSQTITNIIANALYHKKTVLFVAEKMAALEVVRNRLEKLGLSPFCMELHSNKSRKRDVLNQLENALNIGRKTSSDEYMAEAERIGSLRRELNEAADEIHRKRSCGISLYDMIIKWEKNISVSGQIDFSTDFLRNLTSDSLESCRRDAEKLATAGKAFGNISETPLKCCKLTEYSPIIREKITDKLDELKNALSDIEAEMPYVCNITGKNIISRMQVKNIADIFSSAISEGDILPQVICSDGWGRIKDTVNSIINNGREQKKLKSEITSEFEESVFRFDSCNALAEWKLAQNSWILPKIMKSGKLVKELACHAKSADTITKDNFQNYCEKLNKFKSLTEIVNNIPQPFTYIFSCHTGILMGENSDWDSAEKAVVISEKLRNTINESSFNAAEREHIAQCIYEYLGTAERKTSNRENAERFIGKCRNLKNILSELSDRYSLVPDKINGENWIENTIKQADDVISALPMLKEWTGITAIFHNFEDKGANSLVRAYSEGSITSDNLVKVFDRDVCRGMALMTISESSVLRNFRGTMFEETATKYGEVLENYRKLTTEELIARLSARIPDSENADSQMQILKKAIKNGGRGMSIRRLFGSIPELLRKLCPVMLMSPISVAQYIDPSYPEFDYVIFDEASQIPTCEAVGAVSRGKNVIISGDPKQLPPTSFFTASHIDEDNIENEDLESLLDDCLAMSMTSEYLLWHYRSRHESLIAYSNAKYYGNKLYTFPSADNMVSKVTRIAVDGYYDRSRTRTNKAEAEAIVAEIVRRLKDEELRKESIGVVTFSMPQQNLIDDLLAEEYRKNPQLEKIAEELYEPIIIKNLENIQGDERDVIMFSIGYAPDKDGKLTMNFGPLNRDGGWRRLNVAITRAKKRMLVFSVITSDMINLSSTRSEGVEGLKGFLKFAEQGGDLTVKAESSGVIAEGIELIAAEELRKRGYTVDCCVGCSDFKIDIAVADPENPDRYILGIFCGTKSNYENSTAEERYISQQNVLHGLGWETMNLHILDWIDNKEKALERIENRISEILERRKS
ncbi:MAG: DUF4011 domain-containing protein [Ruminococcus sp.]|nr:DUF4011 domain-containing protein [Ruminococcus sp.]